MQDRKETSGIGALMAWWADMGAPAESWEIPALATASSPPAPQAPSASTAPPARTAPAARADTSDTFRPAEATSLDDLRAMIAAFDGCDLKKSARTTVFADGTPGAVMVVGEAPGKQEDQIGRPFVGRSGVLLDTMFATIGLRRDANLYITNLLPWRPPRDRDPTPEEIALCGPFLHRHIALAAPRLIIAVGRFAARFLLGTETGIMRLRGQILSYQNGALDPLTCIPILHPAYLLRRPAEKKRAWHDMLLIKETALSHGIALPDAF